MTKNFTVRLPDEEATDVEALARAEGLSLNETVRKALVEAVERRRADPGSGIECNGSLRRTESCSNAWLGERRLPRHR